MAYTLLNNRLFRPAALLLTAALLGGCSNAFTYSASDAASGRTYLREGDYDSAQRVFARQVQQAPSDYQAYYYLGQAQAGNGRDADAIRSYRTGLEVMPVTYDGRNDDQFRFLLIDALSGALAKTDADGSQLAQIEAASKGDASKKLLVAMTDAKAGRPDSAINAFQAAMTLDRKDPQIAKQFGLYLESLKQTKAAGQVLTRAYQLDTSDEDVAAALRRVGIVPGPSLLSMNDLARPLLPLGPLPEIKFDEEPAAKPASGTDGADRPSRGMPSE